MASASYDYTIERPRTAYDPLAASRAALSATTFSLRQQTPNYIAGKESYEHIRSLSDTPLVSYQPMSQLPSSKVQNQQPMKNKGYIDRGTVNLTNSVLGQDPATIQLEGQMTSNQDRDNVKISTVRTDGYYLSDPGLDSVTGGWRQGYGQNPYQRLGTQWALKAPLPGEVTVDTSRTFNPIDNVWSNGRENLATIVGPGIDSRQLPTSGHRNCY